MAIHPTAEVHRERHRRGRRRDRRGLPHRALLRGRAARWRSGRGSCCTATSPSRGATRIGEDTAVFPFASLGHVPQDLKYRGERVELVIGARNTIREHVTMNPGTAGGGGVTEVGDDNLFMMSTHVAHDCRIGSNVIMANNATLGGHVRGRGLRRARRPRRRAPVRAPRPRRDDRRARRRGRRRHPLRLGDRRAGAPRRAQPRRAEAARRGARRHQRAARRLRARCSRARARCRSGCAAPARRIPAIRWCGRSWTSSPRRSSRSFTTPAD